MDVEILILSCLPTPCPLSLFTLQALLRLIRRAIAFVSFLLYTIGRNVVKKAALILGNSCIDR